jgi:hypothetical protein
MNHLSDRDEGVAGSNSATPTSLFNELGFIDIEMASPVMGQLSVPSQHQTLQLKAPA